LGAVNFSISRELILAIQKEYQYKHFIETGTYLGNTAIWASDHFEKIYTIEIDHETSQKAFYNARNKNNINFIIGDSSKELNAISSSLSGSNIYWLDGHWCQEVPKISFECPLLDELNSIVARPDDLILIDDARFFMGVVPYPHDASNWPRIDEVLLMLRSKYPEHRIVIDLDIIMCFPLDVYKYFEKNVRAGLIPLKEQSELLKHEKKSLLPRVLAYFKNKIRSFTAQEKIEQNIIFDENTNSKKKFIEFLATQKINTLIDVGASHGNFIELVRSVNPSCDVFAFEPLPNAYKVLINKFQNDHSVKLYNLAIGNKIGEIQFFENEYSFSSSVLRLGDKHIEEFPYAKSVSNRLVHIDCLDNVVLDDQIKRPIILKIDVQGLEKEVIEGAVKILSLVDYVLIEVSFEELYEGQSLFEEVNHKLNKLGLFYNGSFGQLYSSSNGKIIQADAFYARRI
jgi:FkbM family methyltransferase